MTTKIFLNYIEFKQRENKEENGVTADFVTQHPNYEKENETNKGCFDCSDCFNCFDCSRCFGCSRCSDCFRCFDCSRCSDCFRCFDLEGDKKEGGMVIPKIENIHQKVLAAIQSQGNSLEMGDWHTCETTHCRFGWVNHLAGPEGRGLAAKTSELFAGMMIYKASSPIRVSPVRAFESNTAAMDDIIRCAAEEAKIVQ